ncbi:MULTISPECIES: dual specificity protein phosphatase [unclassified Spiroplasma]|uniref:dual specificity protein phosphatase family protein n=1 Tax=unclassified Spiroplasma TaxID=2637901 RepID=UPI0030D2F6DD
MKNYRKIINYLYLGDYQSKPAFCEFIVSAASDFFAQKIPNLDDQSEQVYLSDDKKELYLNLLDYPEIGTLDKKVLKAGLNFIDEHLKEEENVFVHCVWGVNRSASLVFIYLVINNHLSQDNFHSAWKQFKKNYSRANPNPAYWHYLNHEFPYNDLKNK